MLSKTTSDDPLTKDNVELELAVKVLISVIAPAGKPAALVTLLKLLLLYLTIQIGWPWWQRISNKKTNKKKRDPMESKILIQ